MGSRVHKDNSSSATTPKIGTTTTTPAGEQEAIGEVVSFQKATQSYKNTVKDIQGDAQKYKRINWFGSSYTGGDIKVVAHMYTEGKGEETRIKEIEQEIEFLDVFRDACSTLISGGLVAYHVSMREQSILLRLPPAQRPSKFKTGREIFVAAAGLTGATSAEIRAGRTLINRVMVLQGSRAFNSVRRAGIQRAALERERDSANSIITSLSDEQRKLKEIKDKGQQTVVLESLQTLSVQTHREKNAVRALGLAHAKGYTRGPRTIAGSMIFTLFGEHPLSALIRQMGISRYFDEKVIGKNIGGLLPDQLPPLDITLSFANEYGSLSELRLYGVEFINDGATYSIEDLLTENVLNFTARDADIMTLHGNIKLYRDQKNYTLEPSDLTGSKLAFNNSRYDDYLSRLGVRRGLKNR